jgi:hypothetical protein
LKYQPIVPPALSSEEAKEVAVSCATIESNLMETAKAFPKASETLKLLALTCRRRY